MDVGGPHIEACPWPAWAGGGTERPLELHLPTAIIKSRADVILDKEGGEITALAIVDYEMSPSSGTLRKGGTVTVTITAGLPASGEQVTVEPGGTVFTIQADQGPGHPA